MYIIVAYDIVDNRKRTRLAKVLSDYGSRVQKSVFECLIDEQQYLKMKTRVEQTIDPEVDSVRYYFLCKRCASNIQVSGWGPIHDDDKNDVIII